MDREELEVLHAFLEGLMERTSYETAAEVARELDGALEYSSSVLDVLSKLADEVGGAPLLTADDYMTSFESSNSYQAEDWEDSWDPDDD